VVDIATVLVGGAKFGSVNKKTEMGRHRARYIPDSFFSFAPPVGMGDSTKRSCRVGVKGKFHSYKCMHQIVLDLLLRVNDGKEMCQSGRKLQKTILSRSRVGTPTRTFHEEKRRALVEYSEAASR
jgi:hypothetical protein